MIGSLVQILSLVAVAVTIYFASLQTRGLREQIKSPTGSAGTRH